MTSAALQSLRVLVAHEWLYTWGGAERVLEQIVALFPQADLAASIVTDEMRDRHPLARRARELWVGRLPGTRTHHRWSLPLQAAAFAMLDTSGYDLVISSSHAFAKLVRGGPGTAHVCYCHSPPRYLWDLQEAYARHANPIQWAALHTLAPALRRLDRWGARHVGHFVANSHYVAGRIARYYDREARVVPPPVAPKTDEDVTAPPERVPFQLAGRRRGPNQRGGRAVRAARTLGVRLVVAGDGPERRRLEALAGPGTEFLGEVTEAEAGSLLSRCAAFVFCAEEDFGIAPIEANAHGAPVVAFGRGGALETMREGETAVFFTEQHVAAVSGAIRECLARSWDPAVLRANAARFAPARFRAQLASVVADAVAAERRS